MCVIQYAASPTFSLAFTRSGRDSGSLLLLYGPRRSLFERIWELQESLILFFVLKNCRKNGKDKDNKESFQIFENHIFQEYTYKKITPCDICSKILRGKYSRG